MTRNPARPSWTPEFSLSYASASRKPGSFKQECLALAEDLAREARGLPIQVCISGGVDGEVVCRSFLELGVSFTPVLFQYQQHVREDLRRAHSFCKAKGLQLKVIPFDEVAFIRDGMQKWIDRYPISEPFVAFDLERRSRLDGYVVFGCGDIVIEEQHGALFSYELSSFFQASEFMHQEGATGCYQFFQGSAELILAFLNDPIIRKWIEIQPLMNFPNSRQFKAYMLKKHWPDMELRRKWNGYERFAALYFEAQYKLHHRYPERRDTLQIPLDALIHQLTNRDGAKRPN